MKDPLAANVGVLASESAGFARQLGKSIQKAIDQAACELLENKNVMKAFQVHGKQVKQFHSLAQFLQKREERLAKSNTTDGNTIPAIPRPAMPRPATPQPAIRGKADRSGAAMMKMMIEFNADGIRTGPPC